MRVDDLTVEVRDRNLKRVGQVAPAHLDLRARARWCGVGEWTLTLPGDHGMVPHLAEPGSGIILLGPDGTTDNVVLSGPTRTPARKRDRLNPDGTFTFSGVTDEIVLAGALAFPDPSIADPQASSVSRSNDTRTGGTESLMRQFVAYNVANGALAVTGATSWAPAGRLRGLRAKMRLQAVSGARGVSQQKSPRFQNLLELLQEMVAYDSTLGFRVVQVGSVLEFQVIDSHDRTKFVRFDVENGTIMSEEVQASGPNLTDAIVAGQGEGTARTIIRRQSLDSITAEEEWGVPFEAFIDQRDTDVVSELQQSGDEALMEGQGGTAVKMIPADDVTMAAGKDWRAGDLVTTVVNGQETAARVTEVAYSVNSAGVMAGAALGDVSGFTAKDAESTTVQSLDSRVSNLERASATPPGTDTLNPTGTMMEFAGTVAPAGYLMADGAVKDRSDFAALFAVIGTTFNTGGETALQFRLPNRKGRVGVGLDSTQAEFDVLGEVGGAKTHTLTTAQMPSHNHGMGPNVSGNVGYAEAGGGPSAYTVGYGPTRAANDVQSGWTGDGGAHNNLQPYIVLNYIIAHGGRSEPVPVPTPVVRFAAFGDSITAVWMPTPDPSTYTGYSWIPHLDGSKFEHVGGYAHGGYTTAQVAANATAVECDLAVIMLGTNDVGPPPWGTEWSIVRQGLIDIVVKSTAPRALLCAAPPRNDDAPAGTAEAQRTLEHNERVRLLALDMGWEWVDPWFTVRAPSGQWAHHTLTDDGIHPTPIASSRCARDISAAMRGEAS